MNVFMLKDVENVGMSGTVIRVADGYANNFLIPRKLAIKVTKKDLPFYASRIKKVTEEKKVLSTKAAMLAERIRNLHLTINKRVHDDEKLYGAVSAEEIVELLKEKDITVTKKQVDFAKAVKTVGEHKVIIKISSKLKPELTLKVTAASEE